MPAHAVSWLSWPGVTLPDASAKPQQAQVAVSFPGTPPRTITVLAVELPAIPRQRTKRLTPGRSSAALAQGR
jgi:hypothetical protein